MGLFLVASAADDADDTSSATPITIVSARVHAGALGATALALCADGTLALLRPAADDGARCGAVLRLALRSASGAPRPAAAAEWAPALPGEGGDGAGDAETTATSALGGLLLAQAGPSGRVLFARAPPPRAAAAAAAPAPVWLLGTHPGAEVTALAACRLRCLAASGGADGSLRLWRLADGALAASASGAHGSATAITALAFATGAARRAPLLASASAGGDVALWAAEAGPPGAPDAPLPLITRLTATPDDAATLCRVTALAAHAGAGRVQLAVGDESGAVRVWAAPPATWRVGAAWRRLPGFASNADDDDELAVPSVSSLSFRSDGRALAVARGDVASLYDARGRGGGALVAANAYSGRTVIAVAFAPPPAPRAALAVATADGALSALRGALPGEPRSDDVSTSASAEEALNDDLDPPLTEREGPPVSRLADLALAAESPRAGPPAPAMPQAEERRARDDHADHAESVTVRGDGADATSASAEDVAPEEAYRRVVAAAATRALRRRHQAGVSTEKGADVSSFLSGDGDGDWDEPTPRGAPPVATSRREGPPVPAAGGAGAGRARAAQRAQQAQMAREVALPQSVQQAPPRPSDDWLLAEPVPRPRREA